VYIDNSEGNKRNISVRYDCNDAAWQHSATIERCTRRAGCTRANTVYLVPEYHSMTKLLSSTSRRHDSLS
jgi:hypothetical protein